MRLKWEKKVWNVGISTLQKETSRLLAAYEKAEEEGGRTGLLLQGYSIKTGHFFFFDLIFSSTFFWRFSV